MFVLVGASVQQPLGCLPLPVVLIRIGVLALILWFVLLLLRAGQDVEACLVLVSGSGMVAVQVAGRLSRAMPSIG